MTTEVVQFREDEAYTSFLRKQGLNPNEVAKESFERTVRMLRAQKNIHEVNLFRERIRKRLGGKPFFEKPVAQLVREDRDSH